MDFFWGGELIILYIELLDAKGGIGEPAWSHKLIQKMEISDALKDKKAAIVQDLKAAFIAHKDAGVSSKTTDYSLQLDY